MPILGDKNDDDTFDLILSAILIILLFTAPIAVFWLIIRYSLALFIFLIFAGVCLSLINMMIKK